MCYDYIYIALIHRLYLSTSLKKLLVILGLHSLNYTNPSYPKLNSCL